MDKDIQRLGKLVSTALERAYAAHESLGARGAEVIQQNRFGENTLRVDLECEKAVLDTLREAQIPIRVISEEHGTVNSTEQPLYVGLLDGLDGTNRYIAGRGVERYGTMFGIFSNTDPLFGDYLASGIMEHSTRTLFVAEKDGGAWAGGNRVRTSLREVLDTETRIYIDQHYEINRKTFSETLHGFNTSDPRSFAVYFADLISGSADAVLACTRKGNLEPAIGFGLLAEAGGTIVAIDGTELRNRRYLEFGQETQIPIIAAATTELAHQVVAYLEKQ